MNFDLVKNMRTRCQANPRVIALPEIHDKRIMQAAFDLILEKCVKYIVTPVTPTQLIDLANAHEIEIAPLSKFFLYSHQVCPEIEQDVKRQYNAYMTKRGKNVDAATLDKVGSNKYYQAAFLVRSGIADFGLAGAVATTSEVIRAALSMIGLRPGTKKISSSFIMDKGHGPQDVMMFADCGVIIDPNEEDLVDIAKESLQLWNSLLHELGPAVIAFLSFSTKGSAEHAQSLKMRQAAAKFKDQFPEILSDGELQFDAAFIKEIGERKAPGSEVPGKSNCFIFPDLNAGNIAYKIAQRLAGYHAYGPILQGVARPFSDLSRGASIHDIKVSAYINSLRQ